MGHVVAGTGGFVRPTIFFGLIELPTWFMQNLGTSPPTGNNIEYFSLYGNGDLYLWGSSVIWRNGLIGDGFFSDLSCAFDGVPVGHNILIDGAWHEDLINVAEAKNVMLAILGFPY